MSGSGFSASATTRTFSAATRTCRQADGQEQRVSASVTEILRILRRAMTSICLSLKSTPWLRRPPALLGRRSRRELPSAAECERSCGSPNPRSAACQPRSSHRRRFGRTRARLEAVNDFSCPCRHDVESGSSLDFEVSVPLITASSAWPFGLRASQSSVTRGRPWVMSSPATHRCGRYAW